jgi:hypothetical protein
VTSRAAPLVVVAAAALLLYFGGVGGGSNNAAAQYRHYFSQGRRACAALRAGLKPTPLKGVTFSSGALVGSQFELVPSRTLSPAARQAFRAGCNAVS